MTAKILIVDDRPENIRLLVAKLENEYYDVFVASSGKEAIKTTKNMNPDIILLDVMMPQMNGFEVCSIIKNDINTMHIPVVMITALNTKEDKIHGLNVGANDFLTKPIDHIALMTRIKSLTQLKTIIDELALQIKTYNQLGYEINSNIQEKINSLKGSSILIIDDDQIEIENLKNNLNSEYNITVFDQTDVYLTKLPKKEFDLIIINTQLKNINALKICSHLKNDSKNKYTPILIIVEENNTQIIETGLDIGINDYIIDPIDKSELTARIITLLKRKKYTDAITTKLHNSVEMSLNDVTTNCYNRNYFESHIKNAILEAQNFSQPLSIIFFDLDDFKNVNDQYGHHIGDVILKELIKCVRSVIRCTDFIARYGGEEFVILLPKTSCENALQIAERIRKKVEQHKFETDSVSIHKTISIGVTKLTNSDDEESVIKRVDHYMYIAKNTGKNKIIHDSNYTKSNS